MKIAYGTLYFSIILTVFFIDAISFIPVLKKIGFLNLQIYSTRGKLLHSPDPILNAGTPILNNFFAASLEKGVLINSSLSFFA